MSPLPPVATAAIVTHAARSYNHKLPRPTRFRRLPVLAEPDRTPYDLHFPLFGFRVRIHPFFWLGTVLLGSNVLREDNGLALLGIWIVVVFVSILVHELGHAVAYRLYGSHAHIILWGFGGLAIGSPRVGGRARRIFVSFAGPLAGFVFA